MKLLGKLSLLLALLAAVALAVFVHKNEKQESEMEFNTLTEEKAVEAARLNGLIHQIGADQAYEVRQSLSVSLVKDLLDLRSRLPEANALTRNSANKLIARIIKQERTRPEYYLANTPRARAGEIMLWAALDQPAMATPAASQPASVDIATK